MATRFGVPQDVYVVIARARRSSRCSRPTSRWSSGARARGARRRGAGAPLAAAVGAGAGRPPRRCVAGGLSRAVASSCSGPPPSAGFKPGSSTVRRAAAAIARPGQRSPMTATSSRPQRSARPVGGARARGVDARDLSLPENARGARGGTTARSPAPRRRHDAYRRARGQPRAGRALRPRVRQGRHASARCWSWPAPRHVPADGPDAAGAGPDRRRARVGGRGCSRWRASSSTCSACSR